MLFTRLARLVNRISSYTYANHRWGVLRRRVHHRESSAQWNDHFWQSLRCSSLTVLRAESPTIFRICLQMSDWILMPSTRWRIPMLLLACLKYRKDRFVSVSAFLISASTNRRAWMSSWFCQLHCGPTGNTLRLCRSSTIDLRQQRTFQISNMQSYLRLWATNRFNAIEQDEFTLVTMRDDHQHADLFTRWFIKFPVSLRPTDGMAFMWSLMTRCLIEIATSNGCNTCCRLRTSSMISCIHSTMIGRCQIPLDSLARHRSPRRRISPNTPASAANTVRCTAGTKIDSNTVDQTSHYLQKYEQYWAVSFMPHDDTHHPCAHIAAPLADKTSDRCSETNTRSNEHPLAHLDSSRWMSAPTPQIRSVSPAVLRRQREKQTISTVSARERRVLRCLKNCPKKTVKHETWIE